MGSPQSVKKYTHPTCDACGSEYIIQCNESVDGFYIEFSCCNCGHHTTI